MDGKRYEIAEIVEDTLAEKFPLFDDIYWRNIVKSLDSMVPEDMLETPDPPL